MSEDEPYFREPDWNEQDDRSEEEHEEWPRDAKVDEAKRFIMDDFLVGKGSDVFWERQIEVRLEGQFFHWITAKALQELREEGELASELVQEGSIVLRLYWFPGNRYWKRKAGRIRKFMRFYSDPSFTRALGNHGEIMFDAALPTVGFMPTARKVRGYGGRVWTATGHDLDRVFVRDGVGYGTEIKNTLPYIPHDELRVKIRMCQTLGLKPLFIVRGAAKSYVEEVRREGGFTLVFKWQLFPHGYEEEARETREAWGLPVDSPRAIQDGTVRRFLNWHLGQLAGVNSG